MQRYKVPETVSREAARVLQPMYDMAEAAAKAGFRQPRAVTAEEFDRVFAPMEAEAARNLEGLVSKLGIQLVEEVLGGLPALRIRPHAFNPSGRLLVYVHGGGYVLGSAKSSVTIPGLIARASGCEVISLDYTTAPRSKWRQTTDDVVNAWKALLSLHPDPRTIGMIGDSAGGGLVGGAVLKMRDLNLPLPGALYLLSPWSDLTVTGDTYQTLADADPILPLEDVSWVAEAYAAPEDQKHPYVSPVYGDFSKAYPPTLIQGGTREIFLSNCVRLYQAIRSGPNDAVLDIYEGLPHVFQAAVPDSPEGVASIARGVEFLNTHLAGAQWPAS